MTRCIKSQSCPSNSAYRHCRRKLRHDKISRQSHGIKGRRLKRTRFKKIYGQPLGRLVLPIRRLQKNTVKTFVCPENFSLRNNGEETLFFFRNVAASILKERIESVIIDHSKIENIDPEVALMMIAEFTRITHHSPSCNIKGRFRGTPDKIMEVLMGVGYLGKFYPELAWTNKLELGERIYLRQQSGSLVVARDVHRLIDDFCKMEMLPQILSKRLRVSLIELMDNAVAHAYRSLGGRRVAREKWWMLGYQDKATREIYFAIMDQGVGMPKTLKSRFIDNGLLIPRNDEEMVLTAFERSFSRTRKPNRGLGLPGLRKHVEAAQQGELFLQTNRVRCIFSPVEAPRSESVALSVEGTILVWKISLPS